MRILIFHGYLLGGTGSNVYNARLAAALVKLGHEVHLLCQDRHPERQAFVDAAGDWDDGALHVRELRAEQGADAGARRRCVVYRPDIGELLPVYVADRYEGIEARTFAECSDAEIARYIDANVAAVREVAALVEPDVALANHLVMGPVILARALGRAVPYAVKVHGSALEYTVKPDPERFLPFAREGLARARGVLVGSRHTAIEPVAGARRRRRRAQRTRLGPPGVDVERFAPREPDAAAEGVRELAARLRASSQGAASAPAPGAAQVPDAFARDEHAAAEALATLRPGEERLVAFVGKLIVSKGVDLLLAAWPLVLQRDARRAPRRRRLRRLPRGARASARDARERRARPREGDRARRARARGRARPGAAAATPARVPRQPARRGARALRARRRARSRSGSC